MNKYSVIHKHKTFKVFTNVSDNLNRKENFKTFDGDKLIAKLPLSWKKSFRLGVLVPHKMNNCKKSSKNILHDDCDKLLNHTKECSANLNELKKQSPKEFGYMLPWY